MAAPAIPATKPVSPPTPKIKRTPQEIDFGKGRKGKYAEYQGEGESFSEKFRGRVSSYQEGEQEAGMSIIAALILGGIAILLDIIDLLDFTGFGAIVTTIVSFVLGLAMFVALYFFDKGDYNFARQTIGWIVEIIPAVGVLPINSFAVILAYYISKPENKRKVREVMEAIEAGKAGKAIMETAGKAQKTTKPVSKIVRAGK
jgi:hypothetical protein